MLDMVYASMMRILKTITEGGQIWAHRVRMAKQVLKIASLTSLVLIGLFFLGSMLQIPSVHYQASAYYLKAQVLSGEDSIEVSGPIWRKISHRSTSQPTLSLKPAVVSKVCKRHFAFLLQQLTQNIIKSLNLGTYTFGITIVFFLIRGLYGRRQQHLKGKQLISPTLLALKLKLSRKASPFRLGHLPLVKETETQHLLLSGATGTGKTNALHSFLPQIRNKYQRAIVVDITGEFVEKYYQPSCDIILNPFDPKSAQWHPWAECSHPSDFNMTKNIPLQKPKNSYFSSLTNGVHYIRISEEQSDDKALASFVFELTNATSSLKFRRIELETLDGKIGSTDYAKAVEKIEFEGSHRARIVLNEARKEIKGFNCNPFQFWPSYFSTYWEHCQDTPHISHDFLFR